MCLARYFTPREQLSISTPLLNSIQISLVSSQVTELNLDNCRSTNVVGLEDFKNLRILSLINVGLTTLKGFPSLPELRKVRCLSVNRFSLNLPLISLILSINLLNYHEYELSYIRFLLSYELEVLRLFGLKNKSFLLF